MRRLAVATVLTAALLASAVAAPAADFGANDDTGKYETDYGTKLYGDMAGLGLRQIVLTTRFRPSDPLTIQDRGYLDRTIPAAVAAGLRVVLTTYPYPPREIESGLATPAGFGAYVATVARAYPEVRQFVIGNEPNQPAFWRPQFAADGSNASAPAFGPFLAAGYDALKAVDPAIEVIGVGLSPRGNDRPDAKSNVSTSPVRFIRALGAWYRSSGRSQPLMDGFSFHPYPNRATDPLDRGYSWPNAGFVNLDRIKQALWDAFRGTAQPTTVEGLKLHLDEVGWQVDTSRLAGYTGLENVVVTDENTQAAIYAELVRRAACDPDIADVSFFGFRDDAERTGFQAALQRLDGTGRPAAEAVRAAIADDESGCRGTPVAWQPATTVLDPSASLVRAGAGWSKELRVRAGEDVQANVCISATRPTSGFLRVSERIVGVSCRSVALAGLRTRDVPVVTPFGAPVDLSVELVAASNPARRTTVVMRGVRGASHRA
jgi:hypothetical protein